MNQDLESFFNKIPDFLLILENQQTPTCTFEEKETENKEEDKTTVHIFRYTFFQYIYQTLTI